MIDQSVCVQPSETGFSALQLLCAAVRLASLLIHVQDIDWSKRTPNSRRAMSGAIISLLLGGMAQAGDTMLDQFKSAPENRWSFVSDQVMGGLSDGKVTFQRENGTRFARMTGTVRLENNGGFIQFRKRLKLLENSGLNGVKLKVRGNNQTYFVHLRTSGTLLPWQYYQARFEVTYQWQQITIPFSNFEKSHGVLRTTPKAKALKSIGIVAYGRAHDAAIDVAEVGFY